MNGNDARSIFISYSSANRDRAQEIEARLLDSFAVWRDKREIEEDWSREISDALAASGAMCLLWSEQAAESKWVRNEWLTARAIGLPIIPVSVDGFSLPPALENLDYIDLAATNALDTLVERLDSKTGTRKRYDYSIRPPGLEIDFRANDQFVGRDRAVRELYLAALHDLNPRGASQIGIIGMGGVGKTQIMIEFAYRFGFYYDHVLWMNASNTDDWLDQFVRHSKNLLQDSGHESGALQTDREWLDALSRYCENKRVLFMMDNVENPATLNEDFLLGSTALDLGVNIMFSSRVSARLPHVSIVELGVMDEQPAYALLTAGRSPASPAAEEHARAICNQLGYLALALVLAGSFLEKYQAYSFANYRKKLEENRLGTLDILEIPASELATRHEAAVAITLQGQWDALDIELSRTLLIIAAQFTEAAVVPVGRLGLFAGLDQREDDLLRPLDDAVNALVDFSLAERTSDAKGIRLHPLVREYAASQCDDPTGFCNSAADKAAAGCADITRVFREFEDRGIDEVTEDIRIALEWSSDKGGDAMARMRTIRMLCDKESQGLRDWQSPARPGLMAAQFLYRASALGLSDIVDASRTHLSNLGVPGFLTRWAVDRRSPLFERSMVPKGDWVNQVCLSPDESVLVTVTDEGKLDVWDAATGGHRLALAKDDTSLTCVTFLADPAIVATGNEEGSIDTWNIETATHVLSWKAHEDEVTSVLQVPDSDRIASISWRDKLARLWDPGSGDEVEALGSGDDAITALAISHDGRRVYLASGDEEITEVDITTGAERSWRTEHRYMLDVICVSKDERLLVTGSRDSTVRVWDLETLELLWEASEHTDMMRDATFDRSGKYLVTAGDQRAIVWDVESQSALHYLSGHSGVINSVAISSDGRRVFTGACDGTTRVWNLDFPGGAPDRDIEYIWDVAVAPNGEFGVTVCRGYGEGESETTFRIWDVETGEPRYESWNSGTLVGVTSDSRYILLADDDNEYGGFDVRSVQSADDRFLLGGPVSAICTLPDGRFIAGSTAGFLHIKDPKSEETQRTDVGDSNSVATIACSPDGDWAASASSDFNGDHIGLYFWRTSTGETIASGKNLVPRIHELAVSKDGTHVLIGTDEGVYWWSPGSDPNPAFAGGERNPIYRMGSTPSGLIAITGDTDGVLRVWDLGNGVEIGKLGAHDGEVSGIAALSDRYAVSSGDDHTLRLWDLGERAEVALLAIHDDVPGIAVASDSKLLFSADHAGNVLCTDIVLPK